MTVSRRHALALLALLPAGCSSPNPNLYTLATVPGQTHAGAPHLVEVREVSLPRYLERSQIVRSSEDYRLDVLPNDWWGESLGSMLSRVLVQDLTQRLPGSTVFSETGAISATPNATVGVNIHRFDANAAGALVLDADAAVTRGAPQTRHVHLTVPPSGSGTPALVGAMSNAIGQLSDVLAGMLSEPKSSR